MRILLTVLALNLAFWPVAGWGQETAYPATALDEDTFVVVSQPRNELGAYNLSLFKIEGERIVLKDSANVEIGELNRKAVLTRLSTAAGGD